ncbi:glycosyltransferase family A protein [Pseudoramibacter faecis]|uniref:glycosyltransferase family 2 protein n=1 Tax=Pseudoramibacter faecis TaxID=3108534 RepID=UPI002E788F9A|nr:glycosyltransferase family A protein [Pseudoramibacter sp. HA2172]
MEQKQLTVSVAAYNVAGTLRRCLDSLIGSDEMMTRLEVIVVNDGSTDETLTMAQTYAERYPQTFKVIDKVNGGYGSTINASVACARGKYFKQLDGDDWYCTENLEAFLVFLETKDSDLVLSPFYEVHEDHSKAILQDHHPEVPAKDGPLKKMAMDQDILMHELAIRTELLQTHSVGVTEHCFYTDHEYTFQPLLFAKSIARFPRPVYCYQLGVEGQSVSLSGMRKHFKDPMRVAEKLMPLYEAQLPSIRERGIETLMRKKILSITELAYFCFLILEQPGAHKTTLKKLDQHIRRQYPHIYRITMKSHTIARLRRLHFVGYSLYAKHIARLVESR